MKSQAYAAATSVMLLAAVAASPAQAGFSVVAYAESYVNAANTDYSRGYNDFRVYGGPGYTSYGGCYPGGPVCTLGGSGTTSSNPNLTTATESTSANDYFPPSVNPPIPPYSASSSAYATANLATASIGVGGQGTYLDYRFPHSGQDGGTGTAEARDNDTLHFLIAGANASTVTPIGVAFTVHGTVGSPTPLGDSQGHVQATLDFGGGYFNASVDSDISSAWVPVFTPGATAGWASYTISPASPGNFTFRGVYDLVGSTVDLGVLERLYASCGLGTSCDYTHTGTLAFTLPSSVSFTSDSGVFLTSPTGGVPEPTTWTMMLVGAAFTGLALRGSRRNGALALKT